MLAETTVCADSACELETVAALTIGIPALAKVPKARTAVPNEYKDFAMPFFTLSISSIFFVITYSRYSITYSVRMQYPPTIL